MTKLFAIALALASCCTFAYADEGTGKKAEAPAMRFEWHSDQSANCTECVNWIYAVGPITERTAKDFERFIAANNVRGATIVLNSPGGSVSGAIALGTQMRALDLNTTVGRAADAASAGAQWLPDASCSSMCAFLLLAGKERHVPSEAKVKVHQIWLADKNKNILDNRYTADEIALVQRDIARLARYELDMTGSIDMLESALQVPAWGPMRQLSGEELGRAKIKTKNVLPKTNRSVAAGLVETN
jgi:hypothetical protein